MQEDYKAWIASGILGGNAKIFVERSFDGVATQNLEKPVYDSKFFETFPTIWASAYAFERSLEEKDNAAVEEWLSLFALHYFGILSLRQYDKAQITSDYDEDLWPALSGTYPKDKSFNDVKLLRTDDEVVVGAYYPDIIFFPGRNRAGWANSESLRPYLNGERLSWQQCKDNLLTDEITRKGFYMRLRSIYEILAGSLLKEALSMLVRDRPEFKGEKPDGLETLDTNPMNWPPPPARITDPIVLLERYPLKKQNDKGGTTYFLVTDMPDFPGSEWMRSPILPGMPSPIQYQKDGNSKITVRFAGTVIGCDLDREKDEIVFLQELFLHDSGLMCTISSASLSQISSLKPVHKIEVKDKKGIFSDVSDSDMTVCLAPINSKFLKYFPEFLNESDRVNKDNRKVTATRNRGTDSIDWTFKLIGDLKAGWSTQPANAKSMLNSRLMIWPPKVSEDWHLYVAHGTGATKEECKRWELIDENGDPGTYINLDDEEYISILQNSIQANRPKALMLKDANEGERGVLFLSEYSDENKAKTTASLSMDFGTSNTCLAYKLDEGQAKLLSFSLSPAVIWGSAPSLENAGFVPFNWYGGKFYPSILLARKKVGPLSKLDPNNIEPKHLFQVDIPGLHSGIEELLYTGQFSQSWDLYDNLKWELGTKAPWRALFLGLSLLYAHAEIFFAEGAPAKINKYVFTHPLALPVEDRSTFHQITKELIKKLRTFCYASPAQESIIYIDNIDESTAIAEGANVGGGGQSIMDVFIDVGGGTTDVAIRHNDEFKVLDSIRVAGRSFFQFAEFNFKSKDEVYGEVCGAPQFKKHLARLLLDQQDNELALNGLKVKLGTFYSLKVNTLNDATFREREKIIVRKTMGHPSYQRYRTALFFRHIIAYSLLQACAVVLDESIKLNTGIRLILGGNAWGLMLFAEFKRNIADLKDEADSILQVLKKRIIEIIVEEDNEGTSEEEKNRIKEENKERINHLKISEIILLNEAELANSKTTVALGALKAKEPNLEKTKSYAGITLKGFRVDNLDPVTIRWYERWGHDAFKQRLKIRGQINRVSFDQPEQFENPLDPLLDLFTILAGSSHNYEDPLPGNLWAKINGELCRGRAYVENTQIGSSPINHFMSKVLYPEDDQHFFLDELAKLNDSFTR